MPQRNQNPRPPVSRVITVLSSIVFLLCLILLYILAPADKSLFWNNTLLAIAGAALIVAAISILDRWFILTEFSRRVDQELTGLLGKIDRRITRSSWLTGIVASHPRLLDSGLPEMIDKAVDQEICILDTYMPDFLQISDRVKAALNNGCTFKILALDPDSSHGQERARLLGIYSAAFAPGRFENSTEHYTCSIAEVGAEYEGKVSLREYTETPVMPLYIIRDRNRQGGLGDGQPGQRDAMFIGFYMDQPSFQSIHLQVARIGRDLFEQVEDYFDRMWERNAGGEVDLVERAKQCRIRSAP